MAAQATTGVDLSKNANPAVIKAAAPIKKDPTAFSAKSKELLINCANPATTPVIPANMPENALIIFMLISVAIFSSFTNATVKLSPVSEEPLKSVFNTFATFGSTSSDNNAPCLDNSDTSATETPKALANTCIAGGNRSPNCCLNSSIEILPLESI